MRLEGVLTCVGYDDYLAWTLPHNKRHFDRLVVVTTGEDTATRELCLREGVECVATDAFHHGGARFHKARAINVGLDALDRRDWVLIHDADLLLPPGLPTLLGGLDPECIYGAGDKPAAHLVPHVAAGGAWPREMFFEDVPPESTQARFFFYIKISQLGSFQLYSGRRHPDRRYPVEYAESSGLFPMQWDRAQRRFLSHFCSLHLGEESANREGRVTARLPPPPSAA